MQIQKRQSRAKARAKTNRLTRRGVPFNHSKFHYLGTWKAPINMLGRVMTVGQVQSYRKRARHIFGGGVVERSSER